MEGRTVGLRPSLVDFEQEILDHSYAYLPISEKLLKEQELNIRKMIRHDRFSARLSRSGPVVARGVPTRLT